ncbi:MAG TPA: DUF2076 domain-containing protein [Edaphobacter sp.]|jgi:hypothetical protein|nr:DUF2076 domain-containing protein [Edaphobacter sp.]
MTPQEQEMIGDLIDRVQKTELAEKDMDAEQMLQQGLGRNPDALYILAQTVLVQKYALEQAQAQLSQAKAQIEQMQQHPEPKHATSFLGSLLGRNESPAPPPPPPPPPQGYGAQQSYPPAQAYPQYAPVGGGYGAPMGGGGFLQNAMQTAAGVAAGALAFEGIESLMHGFGHAAGYGQGFGGFGGEGQRPVEEVVNNYYGDDRGEHGGHAVSADERALGQQEDRDFGSLDSKSGRDSLYGSSADGGGSSDSGSLDDGGSNLDDASFDDGGGSFDEGGSGGGDDSSFT